MTIAYLRVTLRLVLVFKHLAPISLTVKLTDLWDLGSEGL